MSWLRIDDGFTSHPKFTGWTIQQRWAWLETLSYCARYDTEGIVPDDLNLLPRAVTKGLLAKAEKAGLIDRTEAGQMVVHDWVIYNGATVGEKVAYYLERHPEATANQVQRAIGGKRELVLAEVTAWHERFPSGSFTGSPEPARGGSQEPVLPVPKVVLARALPAPTPTLTENAPDPSTVQSTSTTTDLDHPRENGTNYLPLPRDGVEDIQKIEHYDALFAAGHIAHPDDH